MERIAVRPFQPVPSQASVIFHVPNSRLDGAAAPDVAPQTLRDVALEFGVVDLGAWLHLNATIAQVHKDLLGLAISQDGNLLQCFEQRMPIVRIPGMLRMPTTRPSLCVVAIDTLTPNS